MVTDRMGPTIVTLKAEVDFLGAELAAAKAEIVRLRAGGCARDQGTTQYCAEAARMAADNGRLRAALHGICLFQGLDDDGRTMQDIARAALEEGRT